MLPKYGEIKNSEVETPTQCPVFLTNLEGKVGKVGKVGKEGRLRE